MATKIAGDVEDVRHATLLGNRMRILLRSDRTESANVSHAGIPVVGVSTVGRSSHLESGVPVDLSVGCELVLELASTTDEADGRQGVAQVQISSATHEGRHHVVGEGLETVVGWNALGRDGCVVAGSDGHVQDVRQPVELNLVTLPGQHELAQLAEAGIGIQPVIMRHVEGCQDVAHVGRGRPILGTLATAHVEDGDVHVN